ncbi:type II toxin-antitoxin system RelE family toxin [Thermodesulfatator atlanticus]|uniref:type II toxin-antitoxin system RelE family toxin n=1 Tax=Thermodesulfatator atlanticus TaxID=501497 RepID=UPI0003B3FF5F|nr:type II toxin-antitoxin system RelE/ParE family toxin [Thermodesulfatator atlanticus]
MGWKIEISRSALKVLKRLDPQEAKRIRDFLRNLKELKDPRLKGKPLKGPLGEFWRYRVGDYRIICDIQDDRLVVLVLRIGHRREIYRFNS